MDEPRSAKSVFNEALDLPPERRAEFLDRACAGDPALRRRVEGLLASHDDAGVFLGAPTAVLETALPDAPGPGARIGPYRLLGEPIGEGGFGTVYMAEQDTPVRRRVALKVIKLGMDTRAVIARFEAERQALAMMDHPNIARVLDAGATDSGRPYFVMELVRGEPITAYCDRHNLSLRERLDLFVPICQAVQHAHQKGIIHRDLKPSNVLIAEIDGRPTPKVIDFGIAKAMHHRLTEKTVFTEFHQLIGTPEYMSPEQAGGSLDIDTRSDVYSLGVLLYELLTGLTPFDPQRLRSAAFEEIRRIIREVEPEAPSTRLSHATETLPSLAARRHTDPRSLTRDVRGELDWIVMRALEKDRARRYESASALAGDIGRYLNHEPVEAGPPSRAYRLRKLVRRHRSAFAGAAAVSLALVLGLAAATYGLVEARRERDQKAEALHAAERSARRLSAIMSLILDDVIGGAHPDQAQGQDLRLRDVMDRAAENAATVEDPEIEAAVRHQIGTVYSALSLLPEARVQFERALALREPLADARADIAETKVQLAYVLRMLQEHARSEQLLRSARESLAALHGEESLGAAEADYQLAETLHRQGQDQLAAEIIERTLATLDRTTPAGAETDLHALVLTSHAQHLVRQNRRPEALDLLARVADIQRRLHPGSTRLATALAEWGRVLGEVGRLDEAERLLRESLDLRRELLPPTHPALAQSLQALGVLCMSARRPADGEPYVRQSIDIYRAAYGPEHEFVATALTSLAALLASQGKFEEAAAELDAAARIYAIALPATHWRLASARSLRGACLTRLGRYDEAEALLLATHETLAATATAPEVMEKTARRLAELYEAWGRPAEAERWRAAARPREEGGATR